MLSSLRKAFMLVDVFERLRLFLRIASKCVCNAYISYVTLHQRVVPHKAIEAIIERTYVNFDLIDKYFELNNELELAYAIALLTLFKRFSLSKVKDKSY